LKIIKYFFVGGTAASVDLTIFYVFAGVYNYNYLLIGAIGFIVATLVNYIMSINIVFTSGSRFDKKKEIALIYIASIIGLGIHQVALFVTIDILMLYLMLSKLIAQASAFTWNYSIRNYYIFRSPVKSIEL
jgi:putative flippase GtrA